ncbi:conserved hypothetical protein [Leishmania infantum JPCM5]|uniref:GRIP domain-containing protein n=2 Tax=Leishmania infantum TaxID=5671 RepID=A4IAI0_LEIIN|nr:conserved hypothetical protein [Leishmania infantum JPCM5]CAM71837.1 conserved hypothetical protein [Leishmania infantum JPCM5]|eukprot:XP_001468749.1 conserved hypothetical protein [Leishmania infantum JPCM5]
MSSTANRTEDAASSALDGDDATAALLSSPAVTTATAEVAQLRQELHQCQEKFASWKAKAKTGVEQMRAQIVDLTCKLDESNKQRALLEASLGRGAALPALYVAQSQEFMHAHAIAAACLLVDTVLLSHSGGGPGQYKDTAATSPARSPTLQSTTTESLQKTVKDQSDRLKEAHHALKRLSNELQQRTAALHQQDENLADLRRRLAELEACNTSLKQQLMSVPNAQEWKHAQEELDQQLARTRLEYESRESQLVLQHSTEVQALKAVHEREVQEMQREQRDAVAQAVQDALANRSPTLVRGGAHPGKTDDDDAYLDLLNDYKAMEMQCAAATQERDTMAAEQQMLLRELQELLQSARGPLPASAANGTSTTAVTAADGAQATAGWDSFADTANLKEAVRRIHEQRLTFAKLQEELMHSRREVMQLRRCKAGPPEDGLSAQQLQYVRSVVVQLLCSLSDIRVARHLLPVLSMLLKFTDDDLQAITKAMLQ